MCVLPAPLVSQLLRERVTSRLLVTDVGYFPQAKAHGRRRDHGAPEAIVIICVAGHGWCEYSGHLVRVPAGSVLVLPPGQPHLYWADSDDPWTIWWMHVTGVDVPEMLAAMRMDQGPCFRVEDLFRVTAALERIITLLDRDETWPNLVDASGVAWAVLAHLTSTRASTTRHGHGPVRNALEHLRENFASPVQVPELARLAGLSTSHFSALFRGATGIGVTEYVKRLRMARARELLATTSKSIAEIAGTVGYADSFYFSRQFRSINGCSPSDYRRRTHGESVGPLAMQDRRP